MPARNDLNFAHLNGALLVAAVVGTVTGSWTVFTITLMVVLGGKFAAQKIRLSPDSSGPPPRPHQRRRR